MSADEEVDELVEGERRHTGHRTTRRLMMWGASFGIGLLLAATVLALYWLLFPGTAFVVTPPHTTKQVYAPGGPVIIKYESFCTTRSVDFLVQRVAISDKSGQQLFFLPYAFDSGHNPQRCYQDVLPVIPLPAEMREGFWHLEISLSYKANPVRTVTQTFVTNDFEVVDPSVKDK